MKKIVFYIALLLVSKAAFGQTTQVKPSATQNYVHTIEYKKGVQETALGSLSGDDKLESITYFDGLGRPIQEVKIRQGGKDDTNTDTDLITPFVYDDYGRQDKEFLPFYSSSNKGKYDNSAIANVNTYYINKYGTEISSTNPNPYSQKLYEPSPMNRVLKQAFPGTAWKLGSGHEIKFEFKANNQSNEVKLYTVTLNSNTAPILSGGSFYGVNQLYKTITLDENHNGSIKDQTIEEFKDKQGKVILKRSYNNNVKHDTYYVYDDFGNLTFVLPPKMDATSESLSTVISRLDELGYQYKYDARHRIIEKKIPGKGWEYMVYNSLDQVIMSQDANLKAQNKWLFTKYDILGRVAFTGYTVSSASRATLQNSANNTSVQWVSKSVSNSIAETTIFYNNTGYPSMVSEILSINYYDNYSFDRDGLNVPATTSYDTTINGLNLHGLTTGTKVKVLGTNKWITTITGYDEFRRPIWIGTKNDYLSTTNIVESKLKENLDDISGRLQETKTTHLKTGKQNIVIIDTYSYDHSGRVISQTQSINGSSPQAIVENHYDEIGQLDSKEVGGTLQSKLQVVNYKYNIRGWLTNINDIDNFGSEDVFAFKIRYNTPTSGTALFNGNISQTEWKTKSINPSPNNLVSTKYTYAYDALNRIVSATDNTGNYNLSYVAYDKNGNIMSLNRKGDINTGATLFGNMDLLSYSYEPNSNKLKKVTDTSGKIQGFKDGANVATEYTYDQNGNMKTDANKGITSIVYNHLNLPTEVKFNNSNTRKINYTYAADGSKIRKVVNDSGKITTTDYAGNFYYENENLQFFNHDEGYVNVTVSLAKVYPQQYASFDYVYQYKDHLGNVRLSYTDSDKDGHIDVETTGQDLDNDGVAQENAINEENNYYPFGLEHKGYKSIINGKQNNFKTFLGQEWQKELSINWHSYKWRNADPALGRFFNIDPITEDYYYLTPYQFASNNPVWKVELEGLEGWAINLTYDILNPVIDYIDTTTKDNAWAQRYVGYMRAGLSTTPQGTIDGFVESTGSSVKKIANAKTNEQVADGFLEFNPVYRGIKGIYNTTKEALNGNKQAQGAMAFMAISAFLMHKASKASSTSTATSAETTLTNTESTTKAPVTNEIYKRPNNATNAAQRESVQNKPCVDCGRTFSTMFADHIKSLVEEFYSTGKIDKTKMKATSSVQPHCQSCSGKQGARLSKFSKEMKEIIKKRTEE